MVFQTLNLLLKLIYPITSFINFFYLIVSKAGNRSISYGKSSTNPLHSSMSMGKIFNIINPPLGGTRKSGKMNSSMMGGHNQNQSFNMGATGASRTGTIAMKFIG
jgi:hypothetical protein